ncbi:hypothetical protein OPQ81_008735 [Rhizoctonia solani]|nr:hypothetical protein OPQ81_008735 [Rhizoctonia solani]
MTDERRPLQKGLVGLPRVDTRELEASQELEQPRPIRVRYYVLIFFMAILLVAIAFLIVEEVIPLSNILGKPKSGFCTFDAE